MRSIAVSPYKNANANRDLSQMAACAAMTELGWTAFACGQLILFQAKE